MKDTKSFQQTLNKKTLNFLENWYNMKIQEILRLLAMADTKQKEET